MREMLEEHCEPPESLERTHRRISRALEGFQGYFRNEFGCYGRFYGKIQHLYITPSTFSLGLYIDC